jgi:hypothetical protein
MGRKWRRSRWPLSTTEKRLPDEHDHVAGQGVSAPATRRECLSLPDGALPAEGCGSARQMP